MESGLIVVLLTFLLFGALQVARLSVSKTILQYAASAGARARAVGLNDFMVAKVVRTASIPNAGRMTVPSGRHSGGAVVAAGRPRPGDQWDFAVESQPASPQARLERSRIPLYLGATWHAMLPGILDYEDWHTLAPATVSDESPMVRVRVRQDMPLRTPFHRAFIAADVVSLDGEARLETHADLYLEP